MPGLLRGMARTAVVAGTATAVSGRVQRRQAERFAERDANIYAQQDMAYDDVVSSQSQAPVQDNTIAQLQQLGELVEQGVLTQEEFATQKARILGK